MSLNGNTPDSGETVSNQFACGNPESVDHLLKHELKDNCTDVDVRDFTDAMWTKQANRIDYESEEWKNFTKRVRDDKIMKENLQDYKASRKEVELYGPFISLLTRITDLFHEDQAFKKRRKPLFYALRNIVIRCGSDCDESGDVTSSRRKPDGVGILDIGTAGENNSSPDSWRNALLCIEFKIPTATGPPIGGLARDAAPSVSSDLPVSSSERRQTVAPVGQNLASANSSMNHENSSVEGKLANWDDARVKIPSSDYYWAVPQSDTQVSVHSEGERDESEDVLSQRMVQLSSYALEIFHVLGNRIHAFGILAVKSQLTFAYFDRSGAIFATFNLEEMFEELIKFIVAFSALGSQGLGFNVHLMPPQSASCESKDALSQKDLGGYTMTVRNKQITLKSLRDHRYGLVSRGTMVYFGHIEGVDDIVAIKHSWQPCDRTAEWGFIEHAKANGCPDDYLVKVHACAKFEDLALSKGFRSHFLEKGIELNYEDREPRVLVSERLFYIGDLPSEALAHALWYMIRAIRHLDKAGIRHRDISDGNTGWNIREKDGEKRFVAFLYDFDLAKYIGCNQEQSSHCRTGTTPFMAIDLLLDPHCDHYLRYDFESTLWLGFYWCLQYDDDGKKIRDRNFIAEWSSGGFEEVSDKKRGKLYAELYFTRKHNSLRAGIEKLFRVFRQIYNEEREIYWSIESQAGLENEFQELTTEDRNRTKTLRRLELCHWTGCDKVEKAIEIWEPQSRSPSEVLIKIWELRRAEGTD